MQLANVTEIAGDFPPKQKQKRLQDKENDALLKYGELIRTKMMCPLIICRAIQKLEMVVDVMKRTLSNTERVSTRI